MITKVLLFRTLKRTPLNLRELLLFSLLMSYIYLITDPIAALLNITSHTQTFKDFHYKGLFSVLIIAPIVEEVLFRIHLSGQKKHAWGVLLMAIPLSLVFHFAWILIIVLLFGGFIILYYDEFSNFISVRFFNYVFYFTGFIFALSHYNQIDAEMYYGKFIIILIAYFPIGLYFGYIRKKYGFVTGIVIHSFYNFSILAINSQIY
jgi:hypothetical protein